jgi:hypothetical protein
MRIRRHLNRNNATPQCKTIRHVLSTERHGDDVNALEKDWNLLAIQLCLAKAKGGKELTNPHVEASETGANWRPRQS